MYIPGMDMIDATEFQASRVEDWSEDSRSTAIRMTGGVGDSLMVGQVAKSAGKPFHLYVQNNQIKLLELLCGEGNVFGSRELNRPEVRAKYGGIFNCPRLFANSHEIKNNDYYDTVQKYLSVESTTIRKLAERTTWPAKPYAVIHAGSSNPNRRIPKESWEAVARALVTQGFQIKWLGTVGDFGVHCPPVSTCAWQHFPDLQHQVNIVADASVFFGNDSGFCHIAGMQRIKGHVLFTNTRSDHVISKYSTLKGYTPPNAKLSRSLKVNDPEAVQALAHWTPENVLGTLKLPAINSAWDSSAVVNAPVPVVMYCAEVPESYTDFVQELQDRGVMLTTDNSPELCELVLAPALIKLIAPNNCTFTISNHIEEFFRALHEIGVV